MSLHEFSGPLAALVKYQERVKLGGNHRYTVDGSYRPGVTTVIGTLDAPALDRWKVKVQVEGTARAGYTNPPLEHEPLDGYVSRLKRISSEQYEHERLSDEAARIGSDVHALIEHAIKSMLGHATAQPTVCEEALYRFAGWRTWAKDAGLVPLAAEARLYNSAHEYCGSLDALVLLQAKVRGRVTLLDWKPTPTLYDERRLQSSAYRKALVSMGWPEMEGAIVSIPREGGDISVIYAESPGPEMDSTFEAFLALLRVYHWQAEVARRARKGRKVA